MIETELSKNLKTLEGQTFRTMTALFKSLENAGVQLPKGYGSGTRNKRLAEKQARRYIDFKPLMDVDPTCGRKNAQIVTKVYEQPLPKEDGRGKKGDYISLLKPLILATPYFKGQPYELFDQWGVFGKYKRYCFERHPDLEERLTKKNRVFNPWYVSEEMSPGLVKYMGCMSYHNKETLERALDSLQKEEKIKWRKNLYFIPSATNKMTDMYGRTLSEKEIKEERKKREEYIQYLAGDKNCVLNPEVIFKADTWKNHDFGEYKGRYYLDRERKATPLLATDEEVAAYDNYQELMRQIVSSDMRADLDGLCEREEIINAFQIFSNTKFNKQYQQQDQVFLEKILGWEKAWTEMEIEVFDNIQISSTDFRSKANELTEKYIDYMDDQMSKSKFWMTKEFLDDGVKGLKKIEANKLYELEKSKSATRLNSTLVDLYLRC